MSELVETKLSKVSTPGEFSLLKLFDRSVTWIFGVVFLLSGIPHWDNPYFFLGSVYAYKLVSPGIGQMVAIVMPLVQLIFAFCFLTRTFLDAAHLGTLFLFLCFAIVQSTAWFRGFDISCGCFGPSHETTIGWQTLSVIYFLLALSFVRNLFVFIGHRPSTR
ncbi:MAG: hypothetical protein LBJ00_14380 [Planctomycetaceae bacterium]|jgi:hypothetical protein|nr:hypothetical protein [Planctomycetaceae bacterium]